MHCVARAYRDVAKDAAEIVGIRKDVFLQRQKTLRRNPQDKSWNFVFDGDVCARITFFGVMGKNAPAFTVGSCNEHDVRPQTFASPVTVQPTVRHPTPRTFRRRP